ncbi:MAG: hypothetical protein LUI12_01660 [Clostridiales bacterium]|nr:hypothetical protein [Clostridiales bacterium]
MTREEEFLKIKELIKQNYKLANCGFFGCQNLLGDPVETIYSGEYFTLDICKYYFYFELFGATDEEFKELDKYYESLS